MPGPTPSGCARVREPRGAGPGCYQGDAMKKKTVKKLKLAKETVRELAALTHVAGGFTLSCQLTCGCPSRAAACPGTGNTCYC